MKKLKLHFESQTHFQRFALGIVCGLLPILCVLFCFITNDFSTAESVSATYYAKHKIVMIIPLGLCTFFFLTYKGYDVADRVSTIISAIGAFGVCAFPCWHIKAEPNEGLFNLPILTSNALHMVSAIMVFSSFAFMTLFLFTKGNDLKRNKVYKVCGVIMLFAMLGVVSWQIALNTKHYDFLQWFYSPYWVMIFEFIMLESFAVAWIVKSKVFRRE